MARIRTLLSLSCLLPACVPADAPGVDAATTGGTAAETAVMTSAAEPMSTASPTTDSSSSGGAPPIDTEVEQLSLTPTIADCFAHVEDEGVTNLVDGAVETKLMVASTGVWIRFDAGSPHILSHYAITAANDFPARDPVRWSLKGSNDGVHWTELDVRSGQAFSERFKRLEFEVATDDFFRYYHLRLENAGWDGIQMSEVELFGRGPYEAPASRPPAPAKALTAVPVSAHGIDLSWTDDSDDEVVFRVERTEDGETFTTLAYASANTTELELRGLPASTDYSLRVIAHNAAGDAGPSNVVSTRTLDPITGISVGEHATRFERDGFAITIIDPNTGVSNAFKRGIVDQFLQHYPRMLEEYHPRGRRDVRVIFDPNAEGITHTNYNTGEITLSATWASQAHVGEVRVILYAGFEALQGYQTFGTDQAPYWAILGLSDYVRARYTEGLPPTCWLLSGHHPDHHYTDGWGRTARFLLWLTNNGYPGMTHALAAAVRNAELSEAFWTEQTGKTIDELWAEYADAPEYEPLSFE